MLNKNRLIITLLLVVIGTCISPGVTGQNKSIISKNEIDVSGEWAFAIDRNDAGESEQWYNQKLSDKIYLPGSMTTNLKGDDVTVNTPWVGGIADSSWFKKDEYKKYRVAGNVKIPFWLQPVKYYKGAAWYQKTVTIPANWKGRHIQLFIERSHWETKLWVDDKYVDMQNSLGTPDVFDITNYLSPGTHRITIRIDNRIKEIDVGENSHSVSDHTQSNWNGMVGKMLIISKPDIYIDDVQLFPDIRKKEVEVHVKIKSENKTSEKIKVLLSAKNKNGELLPSLKKEIVLNGADSVFYFTYSMGKQPLLWSEISPNLYSFSVQVSSGSNKTDTKDVQFGMREFRTSGTQFTINGTPIFLRGTLECAIFPKTGFPPTDVASWLTIFAKAKSYGLNHFRFHSWCPPAAAFEAADQLGFYLHVECSSWSNQGAVVGDGKPLDKFLYEESNRIVKEYGNHPSFCMMTYGNEPSGDNMNEYLSNFVKYWKQKDSRRLYTTASGWPILPVSDYNSTYEPRIQGWGEGLKSIINGQSPKTNYDWYKIISKWPSQPAVSHEIGQWCVYPDFKEIKKYTGVLKAKNFEIFRDKLQENGMLTLADSFLLASGKLQALCYKADIEAALRTKGMGGFQLLDLHDFPGQGTALVGVLSPFWEDKGYITGKEYKQFCNTVVPLARFPKLMYTNNEELDVPVEVAQFSETILKKITPVWNIKDVTGKVLFSGKFTSTDIPVGNNILLGTVKQSLAAVTNPVKLQLNVVVGSFINSWDFFVYPQANEEAGKDVMITQELNDEAITKLQKGGKVLLTLRKGTIKKENGGSIAVGFSSIFWNTAWTGNQPPHTLGILCNPKHAAFHYFPTDYYSNWQWWDAMSHSDAIILDSVNKELKPIVRVIDDWVTARSLGLLFECKIGNGKLLVSSIDLLTNNKDENRIEARQLMYSLLKYMESSAFHPTVKVDISKIKNL